MVDFVNKSTILLFDVDGTLTKPRQPIEPSMQNYLTLLRSKYPLAVVGGSDLPKIVEQLGDNQQQVLSNFDFVFAENGVIAYQRGKLISEGSICKHIGEAKLQKLINFSLAYMSQLELPVKRGTFIEFRRGMINLSPIGRSCSLDERLQFAEFDAKNGIRKKFVNVLCAQFPFEEYGLKFSIGGQISIDVFPVGWDKTFCLKYLEKAGFSCIHFFGDKTMPGGNDYEIFEDLRTIGHTVLSPEDCKQQLEKLIKQFN